MNQIKDFGKDMRTDYWSVHISEYEEAWNGLGNLMFKNFDDCHFKAVLQDVHAYCKTQVEDDTKSDSSEPAMIGACSGKRVISHMQKNVFALVT